VTAKPNTLAGIGLMVSAMLIFPFLDVCAKFLGQWGVPVIEIVWARLFFGLLLSAPLLAMREGRESLRPRDSIMNALRGFFLVISTMMFFGALRYQGVAETLAIYFVQPLFITALAPIVLKEKVGINRWLAVAIGFVGVLIIIRPGYLELNPGVFLAAGSGLGSAITLLLTRKLAGKSSAIANTVYTNFFGSIFASVILIPFWQTPSFNIFLFMLLLAVIGTFANFLTIMAMEKAEASLLAPLGYTEMINAVLAGWYFFSDFPDRWTFVGVAILIACAIYISYRERSLPRASTEAASHI
jgi:drug/metabolite transporter (DMT)-like permease